MALDPSIILGARPVADPLERFARVSQIQGMQNQNRLADLQFSQAERANQRQNRLAELLGGTYETPEAREEALIRGGFADEGLRFGTDRRANAQTEANTAKARREAEAARFKLDRDKTQAFLDLVGSAKDQSSYDLARQNAQSMGVDVSGAPQVFDPAFIASIGQQALTAQQRIEAEARTRGHDLTQRGQDMTDKRAREEGAANRGVTMRGQNMADARSREATQASMSKPFEITGEDGKPVLVQQDKQGKIRPVQGYQPKGGGKPLTEGQSKDLLFGARMKEANNILDRLASGGKQFSTPGARTGFGIGAAVNMVNSSEGQQLDQAKRNFINAVLRRESGAVIADSEFANGDQQYFPQIGDSPQVIAQKKANRETAMRGILAGVPEAETRVQKVLSESSPKPQGLKPTSPKAGTIQDGYRFKGGDPADQSNWEKQ